ncbi:MAG: DNA-directed RNA polymerase subunit beta' [Clostridiaceae bacterium]|nr:DNA-directed RNA polymerase subunit beta' [Clostridiaceae bacterium]
MQDYANFDMIKIGLASSEMIKEWSRGEVKKPETINYRTLKPEAGGLFCEKIFGPTKDWECHCGKYKRVRHKGIICDRCGVEITKSKVRRERMGHIELAAPVSHIWYFRGIPSRMGLVLDMSPRALEKILYFNSYVVLDVHNENVKVNDKTIEVKDLLTELQYREMLDKYGKTSFKAQMGAEAIKTLLTRIDVDTECALLKEELHASTGQKRGRIIKRLEAMESFRISGNKPEWMILDTVPVIPPDLRPMVQLDGGRFATSDLNDLYRRVINRNNRLKRLLELTAPDIIVRNEKRMLQEAVDALINNGRKGKPVVGPGNRPLKSLSDMLRGKQGRFRQNLLGKRVDYSGRSVIVVGPELKMYQCGLPKEMALELFKPFVMKRLVTDKFAQNIKSAKKMVERVRHEVWDILEDVIKDHPVLLNRAPTLHRLGIQAFEPILVEGRAIKLHPLVCTAYNADFDGDQMAVHVPLSAEAQAEARVLMLSANNLLAPKDGKPITVPTQDMVLGGYYLTTAKDGEIGEGRVFSNFDEMLMALDEKTITLHSKVKMRTEKEIDGKKVSRIINVTCGKVIFNEAIPQDLGFVDRTNPETMFDLEIDQMVGKKDLSKIIDRCITRHGIAKTAEVLDKIKTIGFRYSTQGAISISVSDMIIPSSKTEIIDETEKKVDKVTKDFRRGLITDEERHDQIVKLWRDTTDSVTKKLMEGLDAFNPLNIMSRSGARGDTNQIKQLAGMRGLMFDTSGKTIEIPIKSNFREGLNVLEFFISSNGARKGLADTALRTADSGYLTRRLVDVSQDVIVKEEDCGTEEGIFVSDIVDSGEVVVKLRDRIYGRYVTDAVIDEKTGEVVVEAGGYINADTANRIIDLGIKEVKVRSVLTCKSKLGVCAKCYGMNLASSKPINIGEAVGIIAAQSIGEPGTQLTMRTFHTGGIAGDDITQGLPRVEELFEARKPKGLAIISENDGVVKVNETKKRREVVVTGNDEAHTYTIPYGSRLTVTDNQEIKKGDKITEGSENPHDILRIKGVDGVHRYIACEVQKVYKLQGIDINDKHIEIIVKQMLRKVKVEDCGDTNLIPGSYCDINDFIHQNELADKEGRQPASGERVLLGISKASLATESFLSAASFQETTRVLTEASIKGKTDNLIGLKENVIIGKLIPAGTGMNDYQDPSLEMDPTDDEEEEIITEQTYEDEVDLFEDIDEEEEILDENQSEEYDNEGLLEDADSDDMQDSEEEQKG